MNGVRGIRALNARSTTVCARMSLVGALLWAGCAMNAKEGLVLTGHRDGIEAVAFAPDGKTLVSGGNDCTIIIWDVQTGKAVTELDPPEGRFPDDADRRGGVYDPIEGISPPLICALSFAPDGKTVAAGAIDRSLRLWDVAGKKERLKIRLDYSQKGTTIGNIVKCVAYAPDGKVMCSGSDDKAVRLWSADKGELIRELRGHSDSIFTVAYAVDGKMLASGSIDETIRIWDLEKGEAKRVIRAPARVNSVAISREAPCLVAGGGTVNAPVAAPYVVLWDYMNGKQLASLEGHQGMVCSVCFSPDGAILASAGGNPYRKLGQVVLWDVASRKEIARLKGHSNIVTTVAFSPDGKLLASGSYDKTVRLWDLKEILSQK